MPALLVEPALRGNQPDIFIFIYIYLRNCSDYFPVSKLSLNIGIIGLKITYYIYGEHHHHFSIINTLFLIPPLLLNNLHHKQTLSK